MDLILLRHGNTFEDSETPRWIGANEDLPLTERGRLQARNAAKFLFAEGLTPTAIFSGPLSRHTETASIISKEFGLSAKTDIRLNELDYGPWSGLKEDEILSRGEGELLANWREKGIWPKAVFGSSEDIIKGEIREFVGSISHDNLESNRILVISSNGRLRYFLTLISGALESHVSERKLKVAPGGLCKMELRRNSSDLIFWNRIPR